MFHNINLINRVLGEKGCCSHDNCKATPETFVEAENIIDSLWFTLGCLPKIESVFLFLKLYYLFAYLLIFYFLLIIRFSERVPTRYCLSL